MHSLEGLIEVLMVVKLEVILAPIIPVCNKEASIRPNALLNSLKELRNTLRISMDNNQVTLKVVLKNLLDQVIKGKIFREIGKIVFRLLFKTNQVIYRVIHREVCKIDHKVILREMHQVLLIMVLGKGHKIHKIKIVVKIEVLIKVIKVVIVIIVTFLVILIKVDHQVVLGKRK